MIQPIRITPTIKFMSIIILAAFILQNIIDQFMGGNVLGWFGLVPSGVIQNFKIWQVFSYVFLHADVMHLALNLLMFVFIGVELEALWGQKRFLQYFFSCTIVAAIVYLLIQVFSSNPNSVFVPMVGASAGIYGLLTAYGILFAERTLLFMMLFPMKAKHFVLILMGVEFLTSLFSGRNALSSVAHLTGMMTGFVYLYSATKLSLMKKGFSSRPKKESKKIKPSHLKLVTKDGKVVFGEDDSKKDPKTWH